jgi:cytochrome c oxidase accessory protein FixG
MAEATSLYAAAEKIYPREVEGTFARLRIAAMAVLLGIYYGLPWLQWDNRQAVLFDLPARKFHIFGLTLWPQDFIFLSWLLIIAALSLFFFTALAGRLFCGYACPQTVWTEAFIWMERITEGKGRARRKLDAAPWSFEKLRKKLAKHGLWLVFALWTGFTFVGYFTPITELGGKVVTLNLGNWEMFWVVFYGLATYANAGFMREQVCRYMCPYARFQSAMFDPDSLIISYDGERGEPRGGRKRGVDPASVNLGDCIDCNMCVQVCPTGIDIRNGLQYECIACAACIDACDSVMDKMNYPKGLVRYSTQHAMEKNPTRILRPRTFVYGTLLTILLVGFGVALFNRTPLDLDVIRDRNALFRERGDGSIENVYTLRLINKDVASHDYRLNVTGIDGLALETDPPLLRVGAGEIVTAAARVRLADGVASGANPIVFGIQAIDDGNLADEQASTFFAPRD